MRLETTKILGNVRKICQLVRRGGKFNLSRYRHILRTVFMTNLSLRSLLQLLGVE